MVSAVSVTLAVPATLKIRAPWAGDFDAGRQRRASTVSKVNAQCPVDRIFRERVMVPPDRLVAKVMVSPEAAVAMIWRKEPAPESAVLVTIPAFCLHRQPDGK